MWLERAREAAARGPLGHHTHWTSPTHARPLEAQVASCHKAIGERVRAEGERLRELGLEPTLFCGGGWYTDEGVAEACAELGYVDCTPRARRPGYLAPGERWAELGQPARVELPSGRSLTAIPTTHSLGDLARALSRPWSLPEVTHVYFHDTDLLSPRRRSLLRGLLVVLARRAVATELDVIARVYGPKAPATAWADVDRI